MQEGHGGFGEVAAVADLPFVVGVVEDGSDESDDGGVVGKDSDDAGSAFDLAVDALDGVGRPDLGPVLAREAGEREHFGLGLIHQRRDLGEAGGELVADLVPGLVDRGGVGLGERGAEHRGDHVLVGLP